MNRRNFLFATALGVCVLSGCGGGAPKPKTEDIEKAKRELGPDFKLEMNEAEKPGSEPGS